jgi:hypothetical protein
MRRPEHVEQLGIRDDARIEVECERFGVIAEIVIGRILVMSARVSDARANDSGETPEPGVRRPESTECEDRGLGVRLVLIDGLQHILHTHTVVPGYGLHIRSIR